MDLKEYFVSQSRALSVKLKTYSPTIKKLTSGRGKRKETTGVLSSFDFSSFKAEISYTESGSGAYAQQTLWVSFVLDSDPTLPFSLYDILAFIEPENFNCYTYTYVDSQALMKSCFEELEELFIRIIPSLKEFLESGTNKNKLITTQRETVNKYFGDNVLENSEALGARADTLLNMMLHNFYKAQIEAAVIGAQAVFYSGKTEKALKMLKKAKARSLYQENLLKYLENNGKALEISSAAKAASSTKGALRHGGGLKGGLTLLGLTLLYMIPSSICLCLIYYFLTQLYFRDAVFTIGILENMILIPFASVIFALGLALKSQWSKATKNKDSSIAVHTPKSKLTDRFLKYFIIGGETLAILGVATCLFSVTAFYDNSFSYGEGDFPVSQTSYNYENISYFAIVEGYTLSDGSFCEDKYLAAKTESGAVIDLYSSSFLSADDFLKNNDFFKKKDIEIKEIKEIEKLM